MGVLYVICLHLLGMLQPEALTLFCCDAQVVNLAHLAHLISSSTERFTKLELEWNKVSSLLRLDSWVVCLPGLATVPS